MPGLPHLGATQAPRGPQQENRLQSPCIPKGCLTQMREKAHQAFSPDHQNCLRVQEGGLSGKTGPEEQLGRGSWRGVLQPTART